MKALSFIAIVLFALLLRTGVAESDQKKPIKILEAKTEETTDCTKDPVTGDYNFWISGWAPTPQVPPRGHLIVPKKYSVTCTRFLFWPNKPILITYVTISNPDFL